VYLYQHSGADYSPECRLHSHERIDHPVINAGRYPALSRRGIIQEPRIFNANVAVRLGIELAKSCGTRMRSPISSVALLLAAASTVSVTTTVTMTVATPPTVDSKPDGRPVVRRWTVIRRGIDRWPGVVSRTNRNHHASAHHRQRGRYQHHSDRFHDHVPRQLSPVRQLVANHSPDDTADGNCCGTAIASTQSASYCSTGHSATNCT